MTEIGTPIRQKVERLEEALTNAPQVECPVRHFFSDGLFAREMTIPAKVVIVGAVHKLDNFLFLSSGRVQMATESGTKEIAAPAIIPVKAGAKNSFYALETAVLTNVWANPGNESDIDVLIERVCESKASDLLGGSTNKQLMTGGAAKQLEN